MAFFKNRPFKPGWRFGLEKMENEKERARLAR
jgi:hypothetical protein